MKQESSYNLSYSLRDEDTRCSIIDVTVSFENVTEDQLKERLNVWLTAIGSNCKVS